MFLSCNNFLNAGSVKDEIEAVISYNNAKDIDIQIDSVGMGLITPNGSVTKKLGYDFEIVFKPDTDNYAISDKEILLKAVDYYDHDKVYDNNSVSFTTLQQSDEDKINGLYHVKVFILQEIKNLLIIPNCCEIPKVQSFYPPFENAGYPQDTSIQIAFSSAVILDDFVDKNGYLKNIAISSNGTDLLDSSINGQPYFANPSLSEDGKILTIPVVPGNFLISNVDTVSFKDVTVVLNLQGITDINQNSFKEKSFSYLYRVNSTKDTEPPVLKKINIARTREDAINGTNLISLSNTPDDFFDNNAHCTAHIKEHHVKDFWVYFEAEDEGSGVQSLEITEQLLYTVLAEDTEGPTFSSSVINNDINSKNFSGVYNYVFKGSEDGLVDIWFSVKDRAEKILADEDKKNVLLIKDTKAEFDEKIVTGDYISVNNQDTVSLAFWVDFENYKWFWKMKNGNQLCYELIRPYNRGSWTDDKIDLFKIEYGYDTENMRELPLPSYFSSNSSGWPRMGVSMNVDPYKNVYFKITVKDAVGNINSITKVIKAAQRITSYEKKNNKLYLYGIDETGFDKNIIFDGYFVLKDSNGQILKSTSQDVTNYIYSVYYENSSLVWRYTPLEKITWSLDQDTYQPIETNISSLPSSGYLEVYVCSKEYGTNNKLYKSDPFTIDLSKSGMSSLSAEVPDFEIEKLPVVPNSKKTYFKIKNFKKNDGTAFEGDSQYTYYIKYKKIGEEFSKSKIIDSFSEDLIVEVPNEICAYNFQLVVSNGSAEKCSSEIQKNILSADDSIPPVIHLDSSTGTKCSWMELSTNRLLVKNFFSDSGIGFAEEDYEDAFGVYKRIPVKYCYSFDSKNDSVNWNADYVKTTYSYTRVSSKGTKEPHVLSPYLEFPRDGEKGTYFHVLVQDANKNSAEYSVSTIPGYRELLLCKKAEGDLTVGDVYYNWNVSISFITQYINSDEWEYTNQLLTYANQNHTVSINSSTQVNSNKARKLNLSYTNGEKKSFVRVMFNDGMDTIANIASKPLYYCPGYYEGTVSCKLKGTSNTEFGLAIFADSNSPCFAHTFYSSTNLGNSKEKLKDWLYYGIETGLKMNTGSFTYTDDNYDAVPSGMYYTTIVHFADGTMSMTDVKQKN